MLRRFVATHADCHHSHNALTQIQGAGRPSMLVSSSSQHLQSELSLMARYKCVSLTLPCSSLEAKPGVTGGPIDFGSVPDLIAPRDCPVSRLRRQD
jgi:hypothetical protein